MVLVIGKNMRLCLCMNIMFWIILEHFYRFRPCEGMHKHVFAGQNAQHNVLRILAGTKRLNIKG